MRDRILLSRILLSRICSKILLRRIGIFAVLRICAAACGIFALASRIRAARTFKFNDDIKRDCSAEICIDDLHACADVGAFFEVADEAVFDAQLRDTV